MRRLPLSVCVSPQNTAPPTTSRIPLTGPVHPFTSTAALMRRVFPRFPPPCPPHVLDWLLTARASHVRCMAGSVPCSAPATNGGQLLRQAADALSGQWRSASSMLAATLFSGATSTACCSAAKLVYAGRRRPFTASHVSAAVCVALEEPAMGTVATLPAAAALMKESVRPSSPPGAVQTPTAPAPCLYDEGLPSRGLGVSMMNGDATLDDHFDRLIAVGCQPPGI